jgi:hypothetical protein
LPERSSADDEPNQNASTASDPERVGCDGDGDGECAVIAVREEDGDFDDDRAA